MEGIFTGILDLVYAKMSVEDTANTAPTYGAPKVLGQSIEVKIKPVYKEGKLNASNVTLRKKKKIDGYDVSANTANIPHDVLTEILGREVDANGVQVVNGNNNPAKLALGFVCTLDDGTKEYWWLLKGEFAELEKNAKSEGDSGIDYQTPTIEGSFIRRMDTNDLSAIADTNNTAIAASVFANWFTYVYEPDGTADPDVDSLPIGAVEAVAALPTEGISTTTVYVLTADDGTKLAGTLWRYVSSAWAEYGA